MEQTWSEGKWMKDTSECKRTRSPILNVTEKRTITSQYDVTRSRREFDQLEEMD